MNKKSKAIGYIRVNSETEAGQDNSFLRQKAKIEEASKRSNVKIVDWFMQSENVPAKYESRQLDKALRYCKYNPQIRYLVVAEPSRLAKGLKDFQYWQVAFERAGVRIVSIDEGAVTPMYCFSKTYVVLPSWLHDTNKVKKINEFFPVVKGKEE